MFQSYLSDILHVVAQFLLVPDIILLLAFIAYALFCIGSVIAEFFSERRNFTVVMPKFLDDLTNAAEDDIPNVINSSGLLKRQREALITVYEHRTLPGDALLALVKRLISEEETHYDRIVGRNNVAARVAPMLGLMGTLIPLGPGIEALGRADTAALSSSLLVAFDTTVAGLVVAAVCLIVGKIRSNWYEDYASAVEAAMATLLEKIEDMRPATEEKPSARARSSRPETAAAMPVSVPDAASDFEAMLDFDPMPEFNPQSKPVLAVEPQPHLQPRTQPAFEPQLQPEPLVQPQIQPEPESLPEYEVSFEPEPLSELRFEPEFQAESLPEPEPEPLPESEPEPLPEPEPYAFAAAMQTTLGETLRPAEDAQPTLEETLQPAESVQAEPLPEPKKLSGIIFEPLKDPLSRYADDGR